MNRLKFIKLLSAISLGSLANSTSLIKIDDSDKIFENFQLDLYNFERIFMGKNIIEGCQDTHLGEIHNEIVNNLKFIKKIDPIKKKLIDLTLIKVREYMKNPVSQNESDKFNWNLNSIYQRINFAKQRYQFEVYPESGLNLNLENSKIKKFDDLKNNNDKILVQVASTLERISPDANFIKNAVKNSENNLEEIISLIFKESTGMEFVVSNLGAVNRFQINPFYLNEIYNTTTKLNNELSNYILEIIPKNKYSEEIFLKKLIENSKLNAAVGINLFTYLKNNANKEYEYVVGYLTGEKGVKNLSLKVKDKLEKLTENLDYKDKISHQSVDYYRKFLKGKEAFKKIKNSLVV